MAKEKNIETENLSVKATAEGKRVKSKFEIKAIGENSVKAAKIIAICLGIAIIISLGYADMANNGKSSTESETTSETVSEISSETVSEIPLETVSEIPSETVSEIPSETVSSNDVENVMKKKEELNNIISTHVSDEYNTEDANKVNKCSRDEEQYGDNITLEQLKNVITDREVVLSHTKNSRLMMLLGHNYQRLSNEKYSDGRGLTKIDCLTYSLKYFKESLKYFDNSFLTSENEELRICRSLIYLFMSQVYEQLGDADVTNSYENYCYSLASYLLYEKYYDEEKEYIDIPFDRDEFYYHQGYIYLKIYRAYPDSDNNWEEMKKIFYKCVESYEMVSDGASMDVSEKAKNELKYMVETYGDIYEYELQNVYEK